MYELGQYMPMFYFLEKWDELRHLRWGWFAQNVTPPTGSCHYSRHQPQRACLNSSHFSRNKTYAFIDLYLIWFVYNDSTQYATDRETLELLPNIIYIQWLHPIATDDGLTIHMHSILRTAHHWFILIAYEKRQRMKPESLKTLSLLITLLVDNYGTFNTITN